MLKFIKDSTKEVEDIKLPDYPENYAKELKEAFDTGDQLIVSVLKACGKEQIMSHKKDIET